MAGPVATLRWRSGLLMVVAVVAIIGTGMFLAYAFEPPDLSEPHAYRRSEALIAALSPFRAGGIGWGFLGFGFYSGAYAALSLWRVVDPVALIATEAGLSFHPSLTRRRIAWNEIVEIGAEMQTRSWLFGPRPTLFITFARPQRLGFSLSARARHTFAAVDLGNGVAERLPGALRRVRVATSATSNDRLS